MPLRKLRIPEARSSSPPRFSALQRHEISVSSALLFISGDLSSAAGRSPHTGYVQ